METKRVALSKKLRFDVFKRDGFACMYCGQTPPAVVLEADHILPVCEGGKNRMDNLVTACFDCNRGKGKTKLDVVPESLADRAARIKESESQLRAFRKVIAAQAARIDDDVWQVLRALFGPSTVEVKKADYQSVKGFIQRMPLDRVLEAADIATIKFRWGGSKMFPYFCGVCWRMIEEAKQ